VRRYRNQFRLWFAIRPMVASRKLSVTGKQAVLAKLLHLRIGTEYLLLTLLVLMRLTVLLH
jgi:hypothetical protein